MIDSYLFYHQLEEKVKEKVNSEFKEKITFQVECDLFVRYIFQFPFMPWLSLIRTHFQRYLDRDQRDPSRIREFLRSIIHHTRAHILGDGEPSQRAFAIYRRSGEGCGTSRWLHQAPHRAEEIPPQSFWQGIEVRVLIFWWSLSSVDRFKYTALFSSSSPIPLLEADRWRRLALNRLDRRHPTPVCPSLTLLLAAYRSANR